MSLTVKALSYSGWESLKALLNSLGCHVPSADRVEDWGSESPRVSAQPVLVLHRRPERIIATAMASGQTAQQAITGWKSQSEQLLQWLKQNRRVATLVEVDELLQGPEAISTLCNWLSVECPQQLPLLPEKPTSDVKTHDLDLLLASQLLRQSEDVQTVLGQLEACTLPLSEQSFVVPRLDIESLAHELRTSVSGACLAKSEQTLAEQQQEARQILEQLHAAQEELEKLSIRKTELERQLAAKENDSESARKLDSISAELKAQKQESGLLLEQLHLVQTEFEQRVLDNQTAILQKDEALGVAQRELAQLQSELQLFKSSHLYRLFKPEQQAAKSAATSQKRSLRRSILKLKASELFDTQWYLATYPDVAKDSMDPVRHYLKFGAAEGRDPGPGFSTKGYLAMYPDVAESGINPLIHYIEHGASEGREPLPHTSSY